MKHWILPLIAVAALFFGCPKKQTMQEPAREPAVQTAAPFPEQPAAPPSGPAQAPAAASEPAAPPMQPQRPASGWRVQIFASGTRENARKVAEEARWRFSEHQVFILEQGGLHKVQVGNGLGRVQADQLKQRAKEQGFPGAFAIEVTFE